MKNLLKIACLVAFCGLLGCTQAQRDRQYEKDVRKLRQLQSERRLYEAQQERTQQYIELGR